MSTERCEGLVVGSIRLVDAIGVEWGGRIPVVMCDGLPYEIDSGLFAHVTIAHDHRLHVSDLLFRLMAGAFTFESALEVAREICRCRN